MSLVGQRAVEECDQLAERKRGGLHAPAGRAPRGVRATTPVKLTRWPRRTAYRVPGPCRWTSSRSSRVPTQKTLLPTTSSTRTTRPRARAPTSSPRRASGTGSRARPRARSIVEDVATGSALGDAVSAVAWEACVPRTAAVAGDDEAGDGGSAVASAIAVAIPTPARARPPSRSGTRRRFPLVAGRAAAPMCGGAALVVRATGGLVSRRRRSATLPRATAAPAGRLGGGRRRLRTGACDRSSALVPEHGGESTRGGNRHDHSVPSRLENAHDSQMSAARPQKRLPVRRC